MDHMSERPREFGTEPPDLEEVSAALREDEGVDDRRVVLAMRDASLVVGGSVATREEADRALLIAERFSARVVDRLQVDPALREGVERPPAAEDAEPAEDEVLVGGTDMLAGPGSEITDDVAGSLEENEPLEPPEEPLFPARPAEDRRSRGGGPEPDVDADEAVDDERPAAADLTEQDLREAAEGRPLPSLDPDLDATAEDPGTGRGGVDELGDSPRRERGLP
jgi:hypothetical protein